MLTKKTEYTPGQMIRFEATALCHNATQLREVMLTSQPELDFLDVPAAAGMNSIKRDPRGKPTGINRKREHYDGLIQALERARERTEAQPVSENSSRAWLLLNRCRYHCMTIIGMMEQSAAIAAGSP